ncbi:hypothetical protein VTK73DRAFT_3543 [Phialemonium thermophilum]|uniref:N-acetyltransferase domain-containing protein n=1 Tax=Phialemonium thermophilum TaxID=223376 RepID=A0ABR3XZM5_9PEZI
MAFIRPFRSSDTEMAMHICRATLPPSLASSEPGRRIAPYVWTLQFTYLCPQHCFVVDDGTGRAVGYVIGCPDVFAFASVYPRYVAEVLQGTEAGRRDVPTPPQLERLEPMFFRGAEGAASVPTVNEVGIAQLAYNPRWLLLEGPPGRSDLVRQYRATMHIDLLPEFQGQGWGRQLIDRFADSVRVAATAASQGEGEVEGDQTSEAEGKPAIDFGKGIQIGVSGENTKVVPFYEKVRFRVYPGGEREGNVWMVRDL